MEGKIYKITNIGYNECYYGSTIQSLAKRMASHRKNYKEYKMGKNKFITSFNLFDKYGLENCKIELVENFDCNTREQLNQREGYWIRNNECLNKNIPGRTFEDLKQYMKDYREEHKEEIQKKKKEYYLDNIEQILKSKKEKKPCSICNKLITKTNIARHKNIHIK